MKAENLPEFYLSVEAGDWPDEPVLLALIERAVIAAAETAKLQWPEEAELSLLFTDDAEMTGINGHWRDKHKPTNVLSFPGSDVAVGEPAELMIGDLVFAFETVQREAVEQIKTFENHLLHLIIHGFLHLFGYDHIEDDEAEVMEALEISALKGLGIANPYA